MVITDESLSVLSARLPELAWKLETRYSVFSPKLFPRGLFNYQFEMTPHSCINEIKADLQSLSAQKNERSARYLAERVHQKINVLVQLCRVGDDKKTSEQPPTFSVQAINTRQQWLQTLRENIARLQTQQQALTATLDNLQRGRDSQAILKLQAEIGKVERSLTLAKDILARTMS